MLLNKTIICKVGDKIWYDIDPNGEDFNICTYVLRIFMLNTREVPLSMCFFLDSKQRNWCKLGNFNKLYLITSSAFIMIKGISPLL